MTTLTVLIAGRGGQVARALAASVPEGVRAVCLGRPEMDITDSASIARQLGLVA